MEPVLRVSTMNSELLNILVASLIASIISACIMHSWMAHRIKRAVHSAVGDLVAATDRGVTAGRKAGIAEGKLWVASNHAAELVAARAEGWNSGQEHGYSVGHEAGYNQGHEDAKRVVENFDDALGQAFDDGRSRGFDNGYDKGFESGLEAKGEADYQKAYDEGYIRGEKYGREVGRKQSVDELQKNADKMLAGMGFPEVLGLKGRTMEEMMCDVGVFTGKPKGTRKPKATPVGPVAPVPPLPPSAPTKPPVAKRKRVGRAPEPAVAPAKPARTRTKSTRP